MATDEYATLVTLDDLGKTVADPSEDIRGRKVIDKDGHELGKIDALLIDDKARKIRFLRVETGGFLGLGEKKSLIPIEAIASIDKDEVRINHSRGQVADAPAYDPALAQEKTFYENTYANYDYMPFWGNGYLYPGFPKQGGK
jgi:sporulation protein YlmC with PRC-barrel domain